MQPIHITSFGPKPNGNYSVAAAAHALKSMTGGYHEFMDLLGAPSNTDHFTSDELQHVTGWNFSAILAKSLQWVLADVTVYVPPEIAALSDDYSMHRTHKSLSTSGTKTKNIPDGWVAAPETHFVQKLLSSPNPWTSRDSFLFEVSMQLESHGVAHVLILPDDNDVPRHAYLIPKGLIWDIGATNRNPEGAYQTGNLLARPVTYKPENDGPPKTMRQMYQWLSNKEFSARYIMPLQYPGLLYRDLWTSPTKMMKDTLVTERQLRDSRWATLQNQMTSGPLLRERAGVTLTPGQKEQAIANAEANHIGPTKAGRPRWAEQGYDVEIPGYSAREMEFSESTELNRKETLGQRLTPESVLGLAGSGAYAETIGIVRTWSRFSSQPIMDLITGQMECHLRTFVSQPFDQFSIDMMAGTIDDDNLKQQQLMNEVTATSITVGEFRESSGRKPFGDERDNAMAGQLHPVMEQPGGFSAQDDVEAIDDPPERPAKATSDRMPADSSTGHPQPQIGSQLAGTPNATLRAMLYTPNTGNAEPMEAIRPARMSSGLPYLICDVPLEVAAIGRQLQERVRPHVIDGKDNVQPHVTLHGPFAARPSTMERTMLTLLEDEPVPFVLGKLIILRAPHYDVVAIEIESAALRALQQRLATDLPYLGPYVAYRPHMTIAYVEKSSCDRLDGTDVPGIAPDRAFVIDRVRLTVDGETREAVTLEGTATTQGETVSKDLQTWNTDSLIGETRTRSDAPVATVAQSRQTKPESGLVIDDDDESDSEDEDGGWESRIDQVIDWFDMRE